MLVESLDISIRTRLPNYRMRVGKTDLSSMFAMILNTRASEVLTSAQTILSAWDVVTVRATERMPHWHEDSLLTVLPM